MPGIDELHGPIWVTLIYFALYYSFMLLNMRVKIKLIREYKQRGERFDRYYGKDPEMLAVDRIQLNLLEHMPPFLVLLWLYALVVSPLWATWAGGAYLFIRALYPFVLGRRLGRSIPLRLLYVTFSSYGVLFFMAVHTGVVLLG